MKNKILNFTLIFLCFYFCFLAYLILNLPIYLRYDHRSHAYVNCFGIPKITKVYDITRKLDNIPDPYLMLYEGEAFYEGRATVYVLPKQSDFVTLACINTVGDIIDIGACTNTYYSREISEKIPEF